MLQTSKKVLLGSKSPRRSELLESLSIPFEIVQIDADESFPPDYDKKAIAQYLSVKKADAFRELDRDEILITADTIVLFEGKIYGKPSDRNEAIQMIMDLSGNSHFVITGVTITTSDKQESFSESTIVSFGNLNKEDIEYYVDRFEPYDKAGAYGIQEWIGMTGIEKIEGDYFNVVGLPLYKLYQYLIRNFSRT